MDEALMFVDFLNSDWYDGNGVGEDRLLRPGWLQAFAEKWLSAAPHAAPAGTSADFGHRRLPAGPKGRPELNEADLAVLRDVRRTLRDLVGNLGAGRGASPALVDRLDRFLRARPVQYTLTGGGSDVSLHVVADPGDAAAVAAAVALSAAEFLTRRQASRLKECSNPGCRWVFFDATKNANRRWCDSQRCGNVDKVRRYRERHRASPRAHDAGTNVR